MTSINADWPEFLTEKEWLTCRDPEKMRRFLMIGAFEWFKGSDRKWRLFGCACCRHVWALLPNPQSREAVEVAERFADGLASDDERAQALKICADSNHVVHPPVPWPKSNAISAAHKVVHSIARFAPYAALRVIMSINDAETEGRECLSQASCWREVFGNPFRPISFNPAWRTTVVTDLAQTIYDDRHLPSGHFDNQRLVILADALEEAGCDNADILSHLRGGGDHVRGCWAVDLLLQKE